MKKIILIFLMLFSFSVKAEERFNPSHIPEDVLNLSVKWLKEAYKPTENMVVSPMSMYLAMTLLQSGAERQTFWELTNTLNPFFTTWYRHNEDFLLPSPYTNAAVSEYLQNPSPAIEITNSVWGNLFKDSFVRTAVDVFKAEAYPLPENTSVINKFIEEKTHGKLQKMMEEYRPDSRDLLLVNTVYFKDRWADPFEGHMTQNADFFGPTGTKKTAMMHKVFSDRIPYFENEKMQVIALPYRKGDKMYIFLPKKGIEMKDFIENLTERDLFLEMIPLPVDVYLPRFKIEYGTVEMKPVFEKWGVKRIFNPSESQLQGITSQNAYVTSIMHKAFIENNESGTEAAAATVIAMKAMGMFGMKRQEMIFRFEANRPFVFMINDGLFIGVVNEPDDYSPFKETLFTEEE